MKAPLAILVLCVTVVSAAAQPQVLPDPQPQQVFSGPARKISLLISNASDEVVVTEVRARLYQASSATVVRVSDTPWKRLTVLGGQTIVESVALDFPSVRAETRFLIQWMAGTSGTLGRTEVLAYQNDLLKQLKTLGGDEPLGLFDPENELKPLLNSLSIEFTDLQDTGMEGFIGKLAIVGPFRSPDQMPEGLPKQIEALSKKGAAVIWIQPPRKLPNKIEPSFFSVPSLSHATVVVQAPLVADLVDHPQSQLNLIHFATLALHPEPISLPYLPHEP